jgi:hypothetical protein
MLAVMLKSWILMETRDSELRNFGYAADFQENVIPLIFAVAGAGGGACALYISTVNSLKSDYHRYEPRSLDHFVFSVEPELVPAKHL